jgi:hypothetical protein
MPVSILTRFFFAKGKSTFKALVGTANNSKIVIINFVYEMSKMSMR